MCSAGTSHKRAFLFANGHVIGNTFHMNNAHIRKTLLALKADIDGLSQISREARRPVELDQQSVGRLSRMDAMQMQSMAKASQAKRVLELKRIEAALNRLDAGDYGFCEMCGDNIAPRRLEVDPAVPICINCASGRT